MDDRRLSEIECLNRDLIEHLIVIITNLLTAQEKLEKLEPSKLRLLKANKAEDINNKKKIATLLSSIQIGTQMLLNKAYNAYKIKEVKEKCENQVKEEIDCLNNAVEQPITLRKAKTLCEGDFNSGDTMKSVATKLSHKSQFDAANVNNNHRSSDYDDKQAHSKVGITYPSTRINILSDESCIDLTLSGEDSDSEKTLINKKFDINSQISKNLKSTQKSRISGRKPRKLAIDTYKQECARNTGLDCGASTSLCQQQLKVEETKIDNEVDNFFKTMVNSGLECLLQTFLDKYVLYMKNKTNEDYCKWLQKTYALSEQEARDVTKRIEKWYKNEYKY